eukprot:1682895-Amphidinium_carterae.1
MHDEEWEDATDTLPARAWTSHNAAPRVSLPTPRGRSPTMEEAMPTKPKDGAEAEILRQVIDDLRQQNQ